MKVLITGATGFLGHHIARRLLLRKHELVILSRNTKKAREIFPYPAEVYEWDSLKGPPPAECLAGVEGVIHLAGESVAEGRWSEERKKRIFDSRVLGTRHLWQALDNQVRVIVAASAIGYYGDRGDEVLPESSAPGQGFLADVCRAWEAETFRVGTDSVRKVALRIGVVLGREGGALAKLLPVFRAGVGGPVGSGRQWMSWIHVEDLADLFVEALENEAYVGPINAVAPGAVTNREFSHELGKVLGRPSLLPVPALGLKAALGEMSSIVTASQRVASERLRTLGFRFRFSDLNVALMDLCAPDGVVGDDLFEADQWVNRPVDAIFSFFREAKNLEQITPPWLGFHIISVSEDPLVNGSLIDYRLKIRGVPVRWRTRIEDWEPNQKFVDTQLRGPYSKWRHTHRFVPLQGGTLIQDRVVYRLPLGIFGRTLTHWKVRKDIEEIFAYRRKRMIELFK